MWYGRLSIDEKSYLQKLKLIYRSLQLKMLKGISARRVFIQYPELKKQLRKGVLWNHSYYVETVGSVSEENIRKYIEKQTNSY